MNPELRTRSISAVILGSAVLVLTWLHFYSFAAMCAVGGIILWREWRGLTRQRNWKFIPLGIFYIGGAMAVLLFLRDMGVKPVFHFFALVWTGDIAAYLIGKRFGKHKIAPTISPGKSWEGLAGSILASNLLAAYLLDGFADHAMLVFTVPVATGFAIAGLLGDLFESSLKRKAGVKDSGALIPGHGGLFDRVDALLACALSLPFGYFLLFIFI